MTVSSVWDRSRLTGSLKGVAFTSLDCFGVHLDGLEGFDFGVGSGLFFLCSNDVFHVNGALSGRMCLSSDTYNCENVHP